MAHFRELIFPGLLAISVISSLALSDGQIQRASVDIAGNQADIGGEAPRLSTNGRYLVFRSASTNLVAGTPSFWWDIYRKDLQTGEVVRVSTSATGELPNQESWEPAISANGRYVVFASLASNLVPDDTNNLRDIFVKDVDTGAIVRVSTSTAGVQGNGTSYEPDINSDGRYVSFTSTSFNLVGGDTNSSPDIFRKDLQTGETVRVSVGSSGVESNGSSGGNSISADGRYVAFGSTARNLVSGDTGGFSDIFRKDLQTGAIVRVSSNSGGQQANGHSSWLSISGDGSKVAFSSLATNLVAGDTNEKEDIFLKDLLTGSTIRVSVGTSGEQGNDHCELVALSSSGLIVTFSSQSTNFHLEDTNANRDVFRKDLVTGELAFVSQSNAGTPGNGWSFRSTVSGDGSLVAFDSASNNLVPDDTNQFADVFVSRYVEPEQPRVVALDYRPQLQAKPRGLWVTATLNKPPVGRTSMIVDSPNAWLLPPSPVLLKGKGRSIPFFVRLTRAPVPGEKVSVRTTINGVSYSSSYKFPKR